MSVENELDSAADNADAPLPPLYQFVNHQSMYEDISEAVNNHEHYTHKCRAPMGEREQRERTPKKGTVPIWCPVSMEARENTIVEVGTFNGSQNNITYRKRDRDREALRANAVNSDQIQTQVHQADRQNKNLKNERLDFNFDYNETISHTKLKMQEQNLKIYPPVESTKVSTSKDEAVYTSPTDHEVEFPDSTDKSSKSQRALARKTKLSKRKKRLLPKVVSFKRKTSSSKYKGVLYVRSQNKWRAQVCLGGKKQYIGSYDDEKTAACARDDKVKEMFGHRKELLNFPEVAGFNLNPSLREKKTSAKKNKMKQKLLKTMNKEKIMAASKDMASSYGVFPAPEAYNYCFNKELKYYSSNENEGNFSRNFNPEPQTFLNFNRTKQDFEAGEVFDKGFGDEEHLEEGSFARNMQRQSHHISGMQVQDNFVGKKLKDNPQEARHRHNTYDFDLTTPSNTNAYICESGAGNNNYNAHNLFGCSYDLVAGTSSNRYVATNLYNPGSCDLQRDYIGLPGHSIPNVLAKSGLKNAVNGSPLNPYALDNFPPRNCDVNHASSRFYDLNQSHVGYKQEYINRNDNNSINCNTFPKYFEQGFSSMNPMQMHLNASSEQGTCATLPKLSVPLSYGGMGRSNEGWY